MLPVHLNRCRFYAVQQLLFTLGLLVQVLAVAFTDDTCFQVILVKCVCGVVLQNDRLVSPFHANRVVELHT